MATQPTDDLVIALAKSIASERYHYGTPGLCNCATAIDADCKSRGCDAATNLARRHLSRVLVATLKRLEET